MSLDTFGYTELGRNDDKAKKAIEKKYNTEDKNFEVLKMIGDNKITSKEAEKIIQILDDSKDVKKETIKKIQTLLSDLDYGKDLKTIHKEDGIDGIYGRKTKKALKDHMNINFSQEKQEVSINKIISNISILKEEYTGLGNYKNHDLFNDFSKLTQFNMKNYYVDRNGNYIISLDIRKYNGQNFDTTGNIKIKVPKDKIGDSNEIQKILIEATQKDFIAKAEKYVPSIDKIQDNLRNLNIEIDGEGKYVAINASSGESIGNGLYQFDVIIKELTYANGGKENKLDINKLIIDPSKPIEKQIGDIFLNNNMYTGNAIVYSQKAEQNVA